MRKRMIQKVISFMEKHKMIAEHDLVAAGVSGGADSLCLLFVLLEYRKKVPFELIVVHVNHGIRQEAGEDALFVREICDEYKIPYFLKETDVGKLAKEEHWSEEEAGRKVRYAAFEEALELYKKKNVLLKSASCKIAVAHHQKDVAETVLFHMFRGTGIHGMSGILPVNNHIIRPLLSCSRKEIEEFLISKGQKWCIDKTNQEDTYTRNKIRHHILEYAEQEINQGAVRHVAKTAHMMASLREYLDFEVIKMMEQIADVKIDAVSVDIEGLKCYPELLQGQFLLAVIEKLCGGRKDIGSKHIQNILELIEKNGTKRIHLPGKLEVVKEYNILWIKIQKSSNSEDKESEKAVKNNSMEVEEVHELSPGKNYLLNDGSILEISLINAADFKGIEEKAYTKYFDYDKINSRLTLRFRQSGDYLTINDGRQKKSLKAYFINEKVPSDIRNKIPLIAEGNHILWAIEYRISAYYKVTSETKKILQMTIRRKEHVREN